jgi:hypothetical protein
MHSNSVFSRPYSSFLFCAALVAAAAVARAQEPVPPRPPEHQHPAPEPQPDHAQHATEDMSVFPSREASGTAWLPETTPMYGLNGQLGRWQLMGHGTVFAQFLYDSGERGSDQLGSINWMMLMARRQAGTGRFGLRGMFSVEPWTIRGCGYPDLLATGEVCNSEVIHDRQHPHDLFMEVAAEYDRPIRGPLRLQLYGGLAGEPALGPVAYPHRLSAAPNPLAPISHHWMDASHITFGVITAGVYTGRWKAETSLFNGREPDEHRRGFDFGALDSVSGRVWFLPTSNWALQLSAGHLRQAEATGGGGSRIDVARVTASATFHRMLVDDGVWAATVAWGRNTANAESSNLLLAETNITVRERHAWFARFEVGGKPAHDLDVHGTAELFTVAKLQGGYTRYLAPWNGLKPGFGIETSASFVPASLVGTYARRVNPGVGAFITLRPAVHRH